MRKIIITTLALIALGTPTTSQAKGYGDDLVMPYRFYRRLAKCETNLNVKHSQKNYTSAFGIARGTWMRYSNSTSAERYTFLEQARIVDRIAFLGFTRSNGEHVWQAGPWGFATIKKQNCLGLQGFICRSNHPAVQRWKRGC